MKMPDGTLICFENFKQRKSKHESDEQIQMMHYKTFEMKSTMNPQYMDDNHKKELE
jgi:hypothetical protein